MPDLYFENEKSGKRYKVLSIDMEAGKITLQGEQASFTEKYDKAMFKRMGYRLIQA